MTPPDEKKAEGAPIWLIQFTDLMALLLTFAALMLSMAAPPKDLWRTIHGSVGDVSDAGAAVAEGMDARDWQGLTRVGALDLGYLASLLRAQQETSDVLARAGITLENDRLILSLPGDLLFDTGSARLSAEGQAALFALGGLFARIDNRITVHGHADPRPVRGGAWGGNRALSMARALAAAQSLSDSGYRLPVDALGHGASRFNQSFGNLSEDEAYQRARRVDIVINAATGAPATTGQ